MLKFFKKKTKTEEDDQVFELVCEALKEVMPKELSELELTPTTSIESLGIDSIKYINLIISLEEIIGKDLEEIVDSIDLNSVKKVKDILKLIQKLK